MGDEEDYIDIGKYVAECCEQPDVDDYVGECIMECIEEDGYPNLHPQFRLSNHPPGVSRSLRSGSNVVGRLVIPKAYTHTYMNDNWLPARGIYIVLDVSMGRISNTTEALFLELADPLILKSLGWVRRDRFIFK